MGRPVNFTEPFKVHSYIEKNTCSSSSSPNSAAQLPLLPGFLQIMIALVPTYMEDDLPAVQSMTNTALSLSKGLYDLPIQVS